MGVINFQHGLKMGRRIRFSYYFALHSMLEILLRLCPGIQTLSRKVVLYQCSLLVIRLIMLIDNHLMPELKMWQKLLDWSAYPIAATVSCFKLNIELL